MKAISIKQPWASLIANGIKDIENRTWKLPEKYKDQRVLIHASAKPVKGGLAALNPIQIEASMDWFNNSKLVPDFSCIIGSVELIDCVINHPSIWAEKSCEDLITYNWVLANPVIFPDPIPAKGKLSFWNYPDIDSYEDDLTNKRTCLCNLPVSEETQVMYFAGEYRCRYCGGKWYK